MIQALPEYRNQVLVANNARSQRFQGIVWFGGKFSPALTLVKLNPGDKPITIEGYDLFYSEGQYAGYGDKKQMRYALDQADPANRLLFWGLNPVWARTNLIRWLVHRTGQILTNTEVLQAAISLEEKNLYSWAEKEQDLFNPKNSAILVFGEPQEEQLKAILKKATRKARA